MTHYTKRCLHCKQTYGYQASGHGCGDASNSKYYCPECQAIINEALKVIPVKKVKTVLPVTKDNKITIEEFENRYRAWENNESTLKFYTCRFNHPENFSFKDLFIDGVQYTLATNTLTGEKLLEVEYEKDVVSGEIENVWREFNDKLF